MLSQAWKTAVYSLVAALVAPVVSNADQVGCSSIRNNYFSDLEAVVTPVADIRGNDGWKTLSDGVATYDIDPSFVGQIMDAGGEVNCIRKKSDGKNSYQTLNGWFLNGDDKNVVTSGHFMYDDLKQKRTDFSNCYISTNRDVLAGDNYEHIMIDSNPDHFLLGGLNPAGNDKGQDRALLPLANGSPLNADGTNKINPLTTNPALAESLRVGDSVFMVASARPFHLKTSRGGFEPMIQKCKVLAVDVSTTGNPNQVRTDCDSHKGISGSLLFAVLPGSGAKLKLSPIGVMSNTQSYGGLDDRPASATDNYASAVMLDSKFSPISYRATQAVAEVDQTGDSGVVSASADSP